ncbi:response regulator [Flagellimonas amoyensis]|uniref:response regulator n=1 Tax=Flagellimonas amoyensis TaxID=2169401 RepID=UPI000D3699CE|nr:response regulator [Allomuricauda amoyensis]
MNRIALICFVSIALQAFGQSQKESDSIRVFSLIEKANTYYNEAAYDSAFHYCDQAETLAKQLKSYQGQAFANIKKTEILIEKDEWLDQALNAAEHTLDLGKKNNDSLVISIALMQQAQVKMYQNKVAEALDLFKKSSPYFTNHPSAYAALAHNDHGYAFGLNGQLTEKADQLFKALEVYESMPSPNQGEIAIVYNNLSMVFYELGQMEKAVQYGEKSIEHRKLDGNLEKLALGYCNLSQMYRSLDPKKTEEYQNLCVAYSEKTGNQDRMVHAYITSALMASDAENREKAIEFEQKAISILEQNQNDRGMLAKRYLALGMHFKALKKNPEQTEAYLNKALELSKSAKDKGVISETYNQLSDFYERQNKLREALDSQKKYYIYRDSIITETTNGTIADLETKYETAKKEKEIDSLTAQNALTEQQKKNQSHLFLGLLGLGLMIGGLLFYAYRNKLKTAKKLKELDSLKSRFFANISHEFRTPLTLIKSPLQNLQERENDAEKNKQLGMIEQHSDRMLVLVDQLLQLSKIDSGSVRLLFQKSKLSAFMETLVEPFQQGAIENGLKFSKAITLPKTEQWFDKDVLEKIVSNLLSNALKYTPENGLINFRSEVKNQQLSITVSNPSRLQNKDISKLFVRFHQEQSDSEGVGIGLALVKELVTLYRGNIKASVASGILSFDVQLPLDENTLRELGVFSESSPQVPLVNDAIESLEDRPIMLVADDHADIRTVLKDLFKDQFQILEADTGEAALKIAMEQVPDMVISDVMMPEMNGFELTEKLKSNEATSFVPVMLLTTKTNDAARLQGLQAEADDYVSKPFNHAVLKSKVQQLIAMRQKLRERYSKELVLKPTDVVISSLDGKFIQRLEKILEKELSNSDYTIDDFAKEIGMSRMQLHRKLKTLFGVSATEFIRNERLKTAAELIKKGGVNISEIGYAVGFADMSYFAKCFKDRFGATPSNYSLDT